jgi:3-hydroxyisobutyrate dehydrogenase-like beta-hydroxyacid dehydrogenase
MKPTSPRVAFVGTGIMGTPMARHLLDAGYPLAVWNRSPEKTAALVRAGGKTAASCADALRGADVVICMLSTGPVIDQVLFAADANGVVPAQTMRPGAVLVVMSSIPVETSQRQAKYLAERGVHYVDAPVSGGEGGAKSGRLTIMAGGEESVIARIRPALETMGTVTRVGPVGMGQLAKLANQMIVGITIGAVAEALLMAKRGGADIVAVLQALGGGFADSTVLRVHGKRMASGDFQPGARAVYQLKDLDTAQDFASGLGMQLPLLSKTRELYQRMCATELAELDHSALYLYLEHE